MTLCARCAGIDLDTMGIYVLSDMGTTLESSKECPGCDFIIKVARRENLFIEERPKAQIMLQRHFQDENRVDLFYLTDEVMGQIALRLCSTFGE
jgi:hypothetical protein